MTPISPLIPILPIILAAAAAGGRFPHALSAKTFTSRGVTKTVVPTEMASKR
jgi:hypothetical protein